MDNNLESEIILTVSIPDLNSKIEKFNPDEVCVKFEVEE